jgi:hypothetical protein
MMQVRFNVNLIKIINAMFLSCPTNPLVDTTTLNPDFLAGLVISCLTAKSSLGLTNTFCHRHKCSLGTQADAAVVWLL